MGADDVVRQQKGAFEGARRRSRECRYQAAEGAGPLTELAV